MQKTLFLLLSVLSALLIFSCAEDLDFSEDVQQVNPTHSLKKTCASHKHMESLLSNPDYKIQYEKRMETFAKMKVNTSTKALCSSPVIVPVAVHYQGVNNPNASCLIELAKTQVDILNADFQGRNSDINKWTSNASSTFPGVDFGETCIKFCIADQNHPSGFGVSNGNPAITINKTQGDQVNAWSGYLNIYVQFGTGALGYAPLGGAGNGDGVVIEATAFGAGSGCGSVSPESPFNLGRTTTHEVGHYLLLDHIWGNGCGQDDEVADTPDQASDNNGCPSIGIQSCGSPDLHMNYMDYTDDACMYMFTKGQSQRMETYLASSLSNLINKANSVCSEASQNGGGNGDGGNGDGGNGDGGNGDGGNGDGGNGDGGNGDGNEPNICETPSSSSVSDILETSAHISWTGSNDAIRYQLRYRVRGTSWKKVNTTSPESTIANLLPDTEYQYRIRTRCDFGWTAQTPIKTFTTQASDNGGNGGSNSNNITVEIILDEFGSETTWFVVDSEDYIVAQGGPYRDGINGKVKTKNITLPDDCYSFIIEDYYGDGICCDYGDGSARIVDEEGSVIVESDGQFGTFEELGFCVEGSSFRAGKKARDSKKKNLARKK